MKSVLFVTPRFPLPALKGDQIVCYHRLKYLSHDHRITLLSFYERPEELSELDGVQRYCEGVHLVRLPRWRSLLNMGAGLPQRSVPLQAAYYRSKEFEARLKALLATRHFDVVHGFLLRVAPYMLGLPVPTVLELIDSMQLNLTRRIDTTRGPKAWALREELRRITGFERSLAARLGALTVVSGLDRAQVGAQCIVTIPNGVDTDTFRPAGRPVSEPVIVFSGNMGYEPNILAVRWFATHCFPLIRTRVPNATFIIVGTDPAPEVKALAALPGISVTGRVASMAAVLGGARVAVAPMQSGSGMQNKILEAMACELPVVTTPLGRGDIAARPGEALAVAESAEDFSQAVIDLLSDRPAALHMGRAARSFVLEWHSWSQAADRVRELYAALSRAA